MSRTVPSGLRIVALDVLRGVALCGIILVNIEPVTDFGYALTPTAVTTDDAGGWLQLLVQQRFFPIFSLLFGIGFSLFLNSATQRSRSPRKILARRLVVLAPVGAIHQVLHPGEALLFYAVIGLLVLLPSSWLPRMVVAVGAAVLIPAAVLTGGGIALIPGMFLLGSALVRYGVIERIESSTQAPLLMLAVFAIATVPALTWQLNDLANSGFSASSAMAGLLLAGVYITTVLVALRTPLRAVLVAIFEPLGRMALTNYVSATPAMVLGGHLLDLPTSDSWTTVLVLAAGILALQWAFTVLWLSRYRQGPLEWLWRWATWGTRPNLRINASPHTTPALQA